jgi:hypothetical protein
LSSLLFGVVLKVVDNAASFLGGMATSIGTTDLFFIAL